MTILAIYQPKAEELEGLCQEAIDEIYAPITEEEWATILALRATTPEVRAMLCVTVQAVSAENIQTKEKH